MRTNKTDGSVRFGNLSDLEAWRQRCPELAVGLEFLVRPDLNSLPAGRHELAGGAFALVQCCTLKPDDGRSQRAEVHRRYIDIQMPLDGCETFGFREVAAPFEPYDAERDVAFATIDVARVTVRPEEFAVFYPPSGAHAPCLTEGDKPCPRRKVVVKIPVSD